MGPTTTLGGVIFGAGDGMYGCLNPPDSDTEGIFLGARDGVSIPLDSPMNCGLASQFVDAVVGGLGRDCFSMLLSVITVGGGEILSAPLSSITIGGLATEEMFGCIFGSIRGGGMPVSLPKGICSPAPDIFAVIGGPASKGVRNAFSHDPWRGSVGVGVAGVMIGGGLLTTGPWDFSIFNSAT